MAPKAEEMKAIITEGRMVDKAKQALLNNEISKLNEVKSKKLAKKQKAAAVRDAATDHLFRLSEETSKTAEDAEARYRESMVEDMKVQIKLEYYSEIRDEVHVQYNQIAENFKDEIKDVTRTTLEEELEPVIRAELAVKYEGEVKEHLASEMSTTLKAELEPIIKAELEPIIKAELAVKHKQEVRQQLAWQMSATLKAELEPVIKAELAVKYEEEVKIDLALRFEGDVRRNLAEDMLVELTRALRKELEEEVRQDLREDLLPQVAEEIKQELRDEHMPQLMEEVKQDLRDEEIKQELRDELMPQMMEELRAQHTITNTDVQEDQTTLDSYTASEVDSNTHGADDHTLINSDITPEVESSSHIADAQRTPTVEETYQASSDLDSHELAVDKGEKHVTSKAKLDGEASVNDNGTNEYVAPEVEPASHVADVQHTHTKEETYQALPNLNSHELAVDKGEKHVTSQTNLNDEHTVNDNGTNEYVAPEVEPASHVADVQSTHTEEETYQALSNFNSHELTVEKGNKYITSEANLNDEPTVNDNGTKGYIAPEVEFDCERSVKVEKNDGHSRPDFVPNMIVRDDQDIIPSIEGTGGEFPSIMTQQTHYPTLPSLEHSESTPSFSDRSSSRKRSRSVEDEDDQGAYSGYNFGQTTKKLRSSSPTDYSGNPTALEYATYRNISEGNFLGALLGEGDVGVVGDTYESGPPKVSSFVSVNSGTLPNLQTFMSGMEEEKGEDGEEGEEGEHGEDGEDSIMSGTESDDDELEEGEYDGQQPGEYDNGGYTDDEEESESGEDDVEIAKVNALRAQGSSQKEAINLDSDDDDDEEEL